MNALENLLIETAVFCAAVIAVVAAVVHLVSLLVVWRRAGDEPEADPEFDDLPVTILRPISGMENNIEATLASGFQLDHPDYELVFCAADPRDEAIPLVRGLMAAHPEVPARILTGEEQIGPNPKLNNLVKGWSAARHDWIVMTDSNVLMPADYIDRLFARWTPGTGLVVSPPLGIAPENFGAHLECAFLNSYEARWQLLADEIGMGFAQGKTLFWRRDILDRAGGIVALKDEIAEDAAATKLVRRQGRKVRLTITPFAQPLGRRALIAVWDRQLRWAKLRRDAFPLFFYPEILSGAAIPTLAMLILAAAEAVPLALVPLYVLGWYAAEILFTRAMGWVMTPHQAAAMVLRDALIPALWTGAILGRGYSWRGHSVAMSHEGGG